MTFRVWCFLFAMCTLSVHKSAAQTLTPWVLIDDFEHPNALETWHKADVQNETTPFLPSPQILKIQTNSKGANHYLLKKPAPEGVIGNRKALSYKKLPRTIGVGETYTLYTRINVEYFPNNHSFGLSNLLPKDIDALSYDAFEPMLRVTDKMESNGFKNTGALMVLSDYKQYRTIKNPTTHAEAKPLQPNLWYQIWWVVRNTELSQGGQTYDLYIKGGEFESQQQVDTGAHFRMKRVLPLDYFITISNTGSLKQPYGNGGLRYDDLYMAKGIMLSSPTTLSSS